jgi:hypothetical protein
MGYCCNFLGAFGKVQGGMAIAPSSYPVVESGFSIPMRFSGSLEHEGGSSNMLVDANKVLTLYP